MKRIILFLFLSLFLTGCTQNTLNFADDQNLIKTRPAVAQDNMVNSPKTDIEYNVFAIRAFQFGYEPDLIEVKLGDHVMLTVTSVDVGHGFALPDFDINEQVPAEESVTFRFVADREGEFEFFNPVYSGKGWKDMKGKFIVK